MVRADAEAGRLERVTREARAQLAAWRRHHPTATLQEIEAAVDERLQAIRAGLLGELLPRGDRLLASARRPGPGSGAATRGDRPVVAGAADTPFEVRRGVEYAHHDGVALLGDLYLPAREGSFPAVMLLHGGGWKHGSRASYGRWGEYLAQQGYVAFSINYRLASRERSSYPRDVYDVKASVQYLRGHGPALRVDPDRIAVMGSSAGGHLAALVALSGDSPKYASPYPDGPFSTASTRVRVAVPVCGVFDLLRQWEYDQAIRPLDHMTEIYLGGSPMLIRDTYYEASPINWATVQNQGPAFLVVWGTEDDVVDPREQSGAFVTALKRANIEVRALPVHGAAHFWIAETPVLEPGSFTAVLAPSLLRFLAQHL